MNFGPGQRFRDAPGTASNHMNLLRITVATALPVLLMACDGHHHSGQGNGLLPESGSQTPVIQDPVDPNNKAPSAADDIMSFSGGTVSIPVLQNDSDPDGDNLRIVQTGNAAHGSVAVNDNATPDDQTDDVLVYTADAGFVGTDVFTYTISDVNNAQASGLVMLDIGMGGSGQAGSGNSIPKAVTDDSVTLESQSVLIEVLSNDEDADNDSLSIFSYSTPTNGTVVLDANGTPTDSSDDRLQYTPDSGFTGIDSFLYTVSDGQDAASGVVNIVVTELVTTVEDTFGEVCGSVMIGPVQNAMITIFESDVRGYAAGSAIAHTSTDSSGNWCVNLPIDRGLLLVDARGGFFQDPADSRYRDGNARIVGLGGSASLQTALPAGADYSALTVFSSALLLKSRQETQGSDFAAVLLANQQNAVNAFGWDPLLTPLTDSVEPDDALSADALQYAMAVGASAEILNQLAVDLGITAPNFTLINALIRDLSECRLDGNDVNGVIEVLINGQTRTISNDIDLNLEILRFRNNRSDVYAAIPLLEIDQPVCAAPVSVPDTVAPVFVSLPNNLRIVSLNDLPLTPADVLVQGFVSAAAAADDRDSLVTVSVTLADGSPLPDQFPVGSTMVVFTATDSAGNTAAPVNRVIQLVASGPPQVFPDSAVTDEDTTVTIEVLANDLELIAALDVSSVSIVVPPQHGMAQVNAATGDISYTPFTNVFGDDQFSYEVADTDGRVSVPVPVSVTVSSVNDAPTAFSDTAETNEATAVSVSVTSNDTDVETTIDAFSVELVTAPGSGTAEVDLVSGAISYTPATGFTGVDVMSYRVSDTQGLQSNITNLSVTVIASGLTVNQPPVVASDLVTVAEDDSVVIDVLLNDTDSDSAIDVSSVTVTDAPVSGSVTVGTDGTVVYTPLPDYFGIDSFSYIVADVQGAFSSTAVVNISVSSMDDQPIAVNDIASGLEDTVVIVLPLANDLDMEGLGGAVLTIDSNGTFGTASWDQATGQLSYTPQDGFDGTDSVTYHVTDASGLASNQATITINLTGVNDSPVAVSDLYSSLSTVLLSMDLAANDSDPDSPLGNENIAIISPPSSGSLVFDTTNDVWIYSPDGSFSGNVTFSYQLTDNEGAQSDTVDVTIDVVLGDFAPVAVNDTVSAFEELDQVINLLANDTDLNGNIDPATVTLLSIPTQGMATLNTDGTVTYRANDEYAGMDLFTYAVSDGTGLLSNTASVSISVSGVEEAPVAMGDSEITDEDLSVSIDVLANDFDPENSFAVTPVTIVSPPGNGSAVFNGSTQLVDYQPNPGFSGSDSFNYQLVDAAGMLSNIATVSIVINSVSDAPLATDDSAVVDENAVLTFNVLANDTDEDGDMDAASATIVSNAANGTSTIADGVLTYTPGFNFNGTDQVTYMVADLMSNNSNVATVEITINPLPSPPVTSDVNLVIDEDEALDANREIDVVTGATDPEGDIDTESVEIVNAPANGSAVTVGNGVIRYTPNSDYNGTDSFTYRLYDDTGLGSNISTVSVNVLSINDAPFAQDDNDGLILQGGSYQIDLSGLSSDIDSALDPASITTNDLNTGSLSVNIAGVADFTPDPSFTGYASFKYQISDVEGEPSNTAIITVTVWPANDPDFDGVSDEIEIATGTDPNVADSAYVFIDPDAPGVNPDGLSWDTAYRNLEEADDDDRLEQVVGSTVYVLLANNENATASGDEWTLDLNDNCSDMVFIGSLDPVVVTPQTDSQDRPLTYFRATDSNQRVASVRNCGNIQFRNIGFSGGQGVARGGGLRIRDAEILLESVHVANNISDQIGGGIAYIGNASSTYTQSLTIRNSLVESNKTSSDGGSLVAGAGVYIDSADAFEMTDSRVLFNALEITGATVSDLDSGGGGLFIRNTQTLLSGNAIGANTSDYGGGGIVIVGNDTNRVEHNTISGNEAYNGGALALRDSSTNTVVFNNLMTSNFAENNGGAIYAHNTSGAFLSSNTVEFNVALNEGGALYINQNSPEIKYNIAQKNFANSGISNNISFPLALALSINASYNFSEFSFGPGNSNSEVAYDAGYYLDQAASPAVNHANVNANDPLIMLDSYYTDASGTTSDAGNLDIGYHYDAPANLGTVNGFTVSSDDYLFTGQTNRRMVLTPRINGAVMGPGRQVFIDPNSAGLKAHLYTQTGVIYDWLGTGDSTQLTDFGDGSYGFLLDTPSSPGLVNMDIYIDDTGTKAFSIVLPVFP